MSYILKERRYTLKHIINGLLQSFGMSVSIQSRVPQVKCFALNVTHCEYKENFKGYLCYKMITSQNVLSEAQVMNFFYFVEKLCSVFKIFKFLYF